MHRELNNSRIRCSLSNIRPSVFTRRKHFARHRIKLRTMTISSRSAEIIGTVFLKTDSSLTTGITGTDFPTYETEFYTNYYYDEVDLTSQRSDSLAVTTLPISDWTSFETLLNPTPTPNETDFQYEQVPIDASSEGKFLSSSLSDVLSIATAVFLVSVVFIKVTTLMFYISRKERGHKQSLPKIHSERRHCNIQLEELEFERTPKDLSGTEMATNLHSFKSEDNADNIRVHIHSSTSGSRRKYVGSPPRISLPELPDTVIDERELQDFKGVQEDEYCLLRSQWQNSEVIDRKDIRFNKRIPLNGVMCDFWKGRLVSRQKRKPIFVATPKDFIHHLVSWETLVQKYLSLPVNPQNLQVEGFCIESGKIMLIHEYVDGKLLREELSSEGGSNQTETALEQLMNYSEQVASGMEFAFSHGLSHPALNTSKIRVTHKHRCKLYDFCLTGDATKIVERIKTQERSNWERLPPEFIAKNEYSFASDVWYTAQTVFEIFNKGIAPPTLIEEDTYGIKEEEVSKKPALCPEPVYEIISICLSYDPSLRPNISKLRSGIQQEMSIYLEQSTKSDQDEYSTIEEPYMIMKGKVGKREERESKVT